MEAGNIYNCVDADLGAQLHELFQKGETEVTVVHPSEGEITVTAEEFYGHIQSLQSNMAPLAPAKRLKEKKKLERLKNSKQIRHRTAMLTAEVKHVDLDGEDNYGYDVEGNQIDIEGLVFIATKDYLPGIELLPGEIGAFVDNDGDKSPVRIAGK